MVIFFKCSIFCKMVLFRPWFEFFKWSGFKNAPTRKWFIIIFLVRRYFWFTIIFISPVFLVSLIFLITGIFRWSTFFVHYYFWFTDIFCSLLFLVHRPFLGSIFYYRYFLFTSIIFGSPAFLFEKHLDWKMFNLN